MATGKYKIRVDRNECIGAASCVGVASSTFRLDEEKKAVVISEVGDTPENVLLAARSCPDQGNYPRGRRGQSSLLLAVPQEALLTTTD